jgi:FlaA1/EpsC-like NDP-sugar epimerase
MLAESTLPLLVLDAGSVAAGFWLALAFRFDGRIPADDAGYLLLALPALVVLFLCMNVAFGLYRYVWRYTSANEVLTIGAAGFTSTLLTRWGSILCRPTGPSRSVWPGWAACSPAPHLW